MFFYINKNCIINYIKNNINKLNMSNKKINLFILFILG